MGATERARCRRIAAVREKYQLSHADGNCRQDFNVGLPLPWAGEKHRGASRGDEKKAAMLREPAPVLLAQPDEELYLLASEGM